MRRLGEIDERGQFKRKNKHFSRRTSLGTTDPPEHLRNAAGPKLDPRGTVGSCPRRSANDARQATPRRGLDRISERRYPRTRSWPATRVEYQRCAKRWVLSWARSWPAWSPLTNGQAKAVRCGADTPYWRSLSSAGRRSIASSSRGVSLKGLPAVRAVIFRVELRQREVAVVCGLISLRAI